MWGGGKCLGCDPGRVRWRTRRISKQTIWKPLRWRGRQPSCRLNASKWSRRRRSHGKTSATSFKVNAKDTQTRATSSAMNENRREFHVHDGKWFFPDQGKFARSDISQTARRVLGLWLCRAPHVAAESHRWRASSWYRRGKIFVTSDIHVCFLTGKPSGRLIAFFGWRWHTEDVQNGDSASRKLTFSAFEFAFHLSMSVSCRRMLSWLTRKKGGVEPDSQIEPPPTDHIGEIHSRSKTTLRILSFPLWTSMTISLVCTQRTLH